MIVLQSCQKMNSVAQLLEGQWEWSGFYRNGQPQYDTLHTTIEDSFEPHYTSVISIYIWTDSGTYVHQYQEGRLVSVELSNKVTINEYLLQGDKKGVILDYELDASQNVSEHPRFTALKQDFKIEERGLIFMDSAIKMRLEIEKLTESELVLKSSDGQTSRFKKYGNKP